jgi:3-hydroxy acid dehydrogenase/malonic semialdehyde reductase
MNALWDVILNLSTTVNNAGFVLGLEHVGQIADADIEAMFATNVFGLISMTQLLIKGKFPVRVSRNPLQHT